MRSGVCIQPVEGKQNSGQTETYIMANNSPSWDTPSAPSSPTISDYNGSGRNADDHNTLETNLGEVHYFYHKPNSIIYYAIMILPC